MTKLFLVFALLVANATVGYATETKTVAIEACFDNWKGMDNVKADAERIVDEKIRMESYGYRYVETIPISIGSSSTTHFILVFEKE